MNTTVVQEDGTWELGVPASRIKGESSIPEFSYAGQNTEVTPISKGEPTADSTNIPLVLGIAGLTLIALVVLAFFSGFIGIEVEEDEEPKQPAQIPEGEEWWSGESNENTDEEGGLESYDDHPGWLWNPDSEEWVPDPDFQE